MASRAGYFLAPVLFVVGLAVAGWVVWSGLGALEGAFTRIVVPGAATLTLDETGTYTIFHEAESVIDGKLYAASSISGLRVTVAGGPDGKPVPVIAPSIDSTYTLGGHSGKSELAFDIVTPGQYKLAAAYADGRSEPQTVLAVSNGFVRRLITTIVEALAAAFLGFGAALSLVLTTYFRRRRMRS